MSIPMSMAAQLMPHLLSGSFGNGNAPRKSAFDRRRAEAQNAAKSAVRKWSPLTRAIVAGKPTKKILALIESALPETIDERDHKGRTALYFAVRDSESDDQVILALLDKGADPLSGRAANKRNDSSSTPKSQSPLIEAISSEEWTRAGLLFERSRSRATHPWQLFDVIEEHAPSWNLLNEYAGVRYFSSRWLIETLGDDYVAQCAGPDVPTDHNALDTALMNSQTELAELMIRALERRNLSTDLPFVPRPGRPVPLELEGSTILHRLAAGDKSDALSYVVRRIAPNLDKPRADGMTALHVAVSHSAGASAVILVLSGACKTVSASVNPVKPPMTPYEFARKKKKRGHGSLQGSILRVLRPT